VGEAEVNERESVRGYIKDPPKAGSRWEKVGKNRLNRFWGLKPNFENFEENKEGDFVGSEICFSQ
jgi:hypothetical protein